MNKTKDKVPDERPHQISTRFNLVDVERLQALKRSLALPVRVSDAEIVHQLALVGLQVLETKTQKTAEA
jgi:hypothetical protein